MSLDNNGTGTTQGTLPALAAASQPVAYTAPVVLPRLAHQSGNFALSPPAATITPAAVLQALKRRWMLVAVLVLTGVPLAVAGAWFVLKPSANVRALLLVSSTPPKVIFNLADNTPLVREEFASYQKTQAALVKSRLVLHIALDKVTKIAGPKGPLKVNELSVVSEQADATEWLEKEVQVDNSVAPEILRVSMNGDRPHELKYVIDGIVEAYLQEIVHKEDTKRNRRLDQLEKILTKYEDALQSKRKMLKDLAEKAGSGDAQTLNVAHQFALEQLNLARKQFLECRSEIRTIQVELKSAQGLPPGKEKPEEPAPEALGDGLKQDILANQFLQEIARIKDKMEKTKEVAVGGEEAPAYKKLQKDLKAVEDRLEKRKKELAIAAAGVQAAKASGDFKMGVARQARRLTSLKELDTLLAEEVTKLTKDAQTINKSTLDLGSLKDEIAEYEKVRSKIAEEIEALRVEKQAPSRVGLLESAEISSANAQRKRYMGMGFAGLAVLGLTLFGVSWSELRTRRITTSEDVVNGIGVTLMGSIPYVETGKKRRSLLRFSGASDVDRQRVLVESIDSMRTLLLHTAQGTSVRMVMITSALSGEGKTSLAGHLAASIARTGRKTLLVDCDLRRPALQRVFDLQVSPGLSDLLKGEIGVASAAQATAVEGLWVIPAGQADALAFRALAQGGLKPIFDEFRAQFDLVVVDSCPVLPVVDSLLVAQQSDAVILSVLSDVSRIPTVHAAWKRLESVGVRILGAVVNGAKDVHSGYMYRY